MADPERLELPTPAFEAQCSIQLSYGSDISEIKINSFGFHHKTVIPAEARRKPSVLEGPCAAPA